MRTGSGTTKEKGKRMSQLRIVLLQMEIEYGQPKKNYQKIQQTFSAAKLQPNDLVLLPELWDTGYDLTRLPEIADDQGKRARSFFKELARQYQVYISGGSIARQDQEKVFNTSYLIDPKGKLLAKYDKVHLFRLMEEERYLTAGDSLAQAAVEKFTVAPMICYDLRFPEWFRKSASQGTTLFLLSAQWPTPRIEQWLKLIQARAIENQCFVAAVNRCGSDPSNHFGGNSVVVSPSGKVLVLLGEKEEIGYTTIESEEIKQIRGQIPVLEDRRPELYF